MKKQTSKQAKKASKLAKAENLKKRQEQIQSAARHPELVSEFQVITVKNAEKDPDTTAEVIIQNQIDYTPKVSVIIPVYNVEAYLRECLDTVGNQTLKEIEVVCVDDGSTDNSLDILKEYAKKDNRITVISRENKGVGFSRNQGINASKGEFIAFMDPDDYYPSDIVLQSLYENAKSHHVDICGGSLIVYNENRKITIEKKDFYNYFSENKLWSYLDFQYDYGYQRFIFSRSLILKNDVYFPNYRRFQDPPFMVKAFINAGRFYAISEYTYAYRSAHKEINWTEEKVYHLLQGLRDDLVMAINANLTKLYELTLNRIKKDYKKVIAGASSERIEEIKKEIMDICIEHAHNRYKNDKTKAKVSVISPIYNAEPYLRECLDSIINQTLKDIEIICVNDGSTDNSLEIIKEYAAKDKRIKYIDKPNAGYGQTMNCGMDLASGEYIGIVEPDDFIKPEMYETLYNKAKEANLDIVKANLTRFTGEKPFYVFRDTKYLSDSIGYGKIDKPVFLQKYMISSFNTCCAIYRMNFLLDNKIRYNETPGAAFQDTSFWFKTHCIAQKICILDEQFYMYRQDNPNQSIKSLNTAYAINNEYHLVKEFLDENNLVDFKTDYYRRKINGYMWNLNRLQGKIKQEYLASIHNELQNELNDIDIEVLPSETQNFLSKIVSDDYKTLANTKVSVIIPVYNVEKYLRECLDSAINQTLKDIEIICVNDGSTDNSLAILKEYAAKDNRIIIIDQKNQGLSCSRNNAIKVAEGEYILFLDSDDWLRLDTCELLYKKAKKYKLDMLNFSGINYNTNTKITQQSPGQTMNYLPNNKAYYVRSELLDFIYNIPISACRFFYRREFLDNHNIRFPEGINFEDNYFVRKSLIFVENYGAEREILYFRRVHGESITQNQNKFFNDYIEVTRRISDLYSQHNIDKNIAKKVIQSYCNNLFNQYYKFRKDDILKYRKPLFSFLMKMQKKYHFYDKRFQENYNPYKNQLERWWYNYLKTPLNLDNPKTLNEKIQWMKLCDSTPIKTRLADKYLVRDWVKEKIGEEYLIPLLGVYDKFEDIDFDKLPNQFVIKCNHGSAYNIIVKDKSKLDLADVKIKLDRWMSENFAFKAGYELHYRDIQPKIVIEKYLEDASGNLRDYKFMCFDNKVKLILVDSDRYIGHKRNVYDENWNLQNFSNYPKIEEKISKPANLSKLKELVKILSAEFNFVRVDFYIVENKIYFGEMTFTPGSGSLGFPYEIDLELGSLIKLPKLAYNIDTGKYYKPHKPSLIKKYLLFPYYKLKLPVLRAKYFAAQLELAQNSLHSFRVDVKNLGSAENAVSITAPDTQVTIPAWFTNAQGIGQVVSGSSSKQKLTIKAIKSGTLRFDFRGQDKRDVNKTRFPLWIDYKSIKIDGKELLSAPIATWHDKPYRYEMPVKDGQEITVEFEQQPHPYTSDELKDLILKLNPNSDYITQNIDKIVNYVFAQNNGINLVCTKLSKYPTIKADCFIPIGTKCRAAYQLQKHGLRKYALPFDYLGGFSLKFIISTLKEGINSWFEEYFEDKTKSSKKERCIYDLKNKFRSRHIFSADKKIEEQMPIFRETFNRRFERLKEVLNKSEHICFVCNNRHEPVPDFVVSGKIEKNKKDTISDFVDFLNDLKQMYPHKKWMLLHVEHSDNEHEISEYQAGNDMTIYNIKAYDIHEDNNVKDNNYWKGNTKLWNKICARLSLNSTDKKSTENIKAAFKHFLYHKVKTDSYTKTYICGVRVKKKPANIYEFIDKRLATLSKNWEKKFETVANSGANNKKELLAQMTSLNSACQKELKATGTALKKDISALQKETNLIKSNSLYMIKSLNDKMAEVMGGQTVAAENLQVIQAENTAEILNYMTRLPETLQRSATANRSAILDEIAKLPENIAKKSAVNKAEILESIAQISENAKTNRSAILSELNKLPENIAKNSVANKAEILASVAQISENAKANRSAILSELNKLPESIAKNSVANKAEILESVAQISENAKTNRSAILEQTEQLKAAIGSQIVNFETQQNSQNEAIKSLLADGTAKTEQQFTEQLKNYDILSKKLDNKTSSIITAVERDQILYTNPFEVRTREERGLCDIVNAPDFENRFRKLIANLPQESVATIVNIIKRLQLIKGTNNKLDLYSAEEKTQMKCLKSYFQSILKISDNLYCCQHYFLPINHFEPSVFFYKHGLNKLKNLNYFKNKAILDVGAFIGDSALILSPMTTDKVYSFEATTENYNNMLKTIELNNLTNVVAIKTAVGSENTNIDIRYGGSASSSSELMIKEPKYIEKCPVICIDDYVKEHNLNVGLIKVDIEGAEQDFLKGAMQTIKEYKPTMLISIYHNIDDFLDIKPMIESWNLGYKFTVFKPVIGSISGETLLICEQ